MDILNQYREYISKFLAGAVVALVFGLIGLPIWIVGGLVGVGLGFLAPEIDKVLASALETGGASDVDKDISEASSTGESAQALGVIDDAADVALTATKTTKAKPAAKRKPKAPAKRKPPAKKD